MPGPALRSTLILLAALGCTDEIDLPPVSRPVDAGGERAGDTPDGRVDVPDAAVDAPDGPVDAPDGPVDVPDAAGTCAPGSVCRPASCAGDLFQPEAICDARRLCPAPVAIQCAPTRCRDGRCLTQCAGDQDCVQPALCMGGTCRRGQDCLTPDQCASGFCVQGLCCDRACTSPCESCALPASRGRCTPLPAALQPDAGCARDGGAD